LFIHYVTLFFSGVYALYISKVPSTNVFPVFSRKGSEWDVVDVCVYP
jgi:hypothetical protein